MARYVKGGAGAGSAAPSTPNRSGDRILELRLDGAVLLIRESDGESTNEDRLTCEGPAAARWEHDRRVARAIAEGFRPASDAATPAGGRHAELEDAIRGSPDEPDAYLVYADWLQGQGDARGELICVQHATAEHRRRSRTDNERFFSEQALSLERAELLLMMTHREQLLGPVLSRVYDEDQQTYVMDLFALEWFLGFIRHAALSRSPRRRGEETALWSALLQTDSAKFIRSVALDWADLDQLAAVELPPTLEAVEVLLDSWWPPEQEDDARRVEHGGTLDQAVGPPAEHAARILEALAPILAGAAPGLRRLGLQRCHFGAALIDALVASPLREQLRELDLSQGALTDADIPKLQAHAAALGRLERLDLRRNRFSPKGRGSVRRLGGFIVVEER
jgi:uncharacterized protein (TIGR02996 family)